jgi:tetratricopeptide (TPR) repeat protein
MMKSIHSLISSKVLLPSMFWSGILLSPLLWADTLTDIAPLQHGWAQANYSVAEDQREKAFAALVTQADAVVAAHAGEAEPLIWRGIIKSSYAGAKGGLGALSVAESSKADFEAAMAINAQALQGSAYTSLGVLYSKVPGWPIGFGSSKKAKELLEKALSMNPQGIDPNYFYAEYLYEKRDYQDAMRYLELAKQAPARVGREDADAGRQQDIAVLEARLQKKLGK